MILSFHRYHSSDFKGTKISGLYTHMIYLHSQFRASPAFREVSEHSRRCFISGGNEAKDITQPFNYGICRSLPILYNCIKKIMINYIKISTSIFCVKFNCAEIHFFY
jgi:hypothetical protein